MEFQHILRLLNTNVDGKEKIMYALTSIKGIGRRFANICCKKAEVDMKKRAGGSITAPSPAVAPMHATCRMPLKLCFPPCFHTSAPHALCRRVLC